MAEVLPPQGRSEFKSGFRRRWNVDRVPWKVLLGMAMQENNAGYQRAMYEVLIDIATGPGMEYPVFKPLRIK